MGSGRGGRGSRARGRPRVRRVADRRRRFVRRRRRRRQVDWNRDSVSLGH